MNADADADEANAVGDVVPCAYCGYQSCACSQCTCIRLAPTAGPCPGCRKHSAVMRAAFPCAHPEMCPCPGCQRYRVNANVDQIKYTPLDVLGVAKDVLQYEEVSYTKRVRYTDPTLSPSTQLTDVSLHGPRCICGHVRLDHWGPCYFESCECRKYVKA